MCKSSPNSHVPRNSSKAPRALFKALRCDACRSLLPALLIVTCAAFLSACVIVPIPPVTQSEPPAGFQAEALASVHKGLSRGEVLMVLGNPHLATPDYRYLGYQWFEKSFDALYGWFIGGGLQGIGGAGVHTGQHDEHVLMIEFDAGGRVTRTREFSSGARSSLRSNIQRWIQSASRSSR